MSGSCRFGFVCFFFGPNDMRVPYRIWIQLDRWLHWLQVKLVLVYSGGQLQTGHLYIKPQAVGFRVVNSIDTVEMPILPIEPVGHCISLMALHDIKWCSCELNKTDRCCLKSHELMALPLSLITIKHLIEEELINWMIFLFGYFS
jgi:hypothetical protein